MTRSLKKYGQNISQLLRTLECLDTWHMAMFKRKKDKSWITSVRSAFSYVIGLNEGHIDSITPWPIRSSLVEMSCLLRMSHGYFFIHLTWNTHSWWRWWVSRGEWWYRVRYGELSITPNIDNLVSRLSHNLVQESSR